jgi:hypothetical protein
MTAALLYALTSFAMVQASIWPEDMGGNLLGDDPNPTFPRQTSIFEDDSSDLLRQSGVNPIAVYPNMSMPGMPRGPKRRQLSGRLEARQEVCAFFLYFLSSSGRYTHRVKLSRRALRVAENADHIPKIIGIRVDNVRKLDMFWYVQLQNKILVARQDIQCVSSCRL